MILYSCTGSLRFSPYLKSIKVWDYSNILYSCSKDFTALGKYSWVSLWCCQMLVLVGAGMSRILISQPHLKKRDFMLSIYSISKVQVPQNWVVTFYQQACVPKSSCDGMLWNIPEADPRKYCLNILLWASYGHGNIHMTFDLCPSLWSWSASCYINTL